MAHVVAYEVPITFHGFPVHLQSFFGGAGHLEAATIGVMNRQGRTVRLEAYPTVPNGPKVLFYFFHCVKILLLLTRIPSENQICYLVFGNLEYAFG